MSDSIELTILMPCLNEAGTIQQCVTEALSALNAMGIKGEVLVADNGSTDGSPELAKALGARVILVNQRGYGAALIAGIHAAHGQYTIMGDCDCSYDFTEAKRLLELLRAGNDLVVGCRLPQYGGKIEEGAMPFLHRYLGNPVLSLLGRLFFAAPINDFHCGLRGFVTSRARQLQLKATGMEFASEMIVKAAVAGHRISETPITLRKDRRGRPPHLRTWRDGWRHLRFLLLNSPRWLFFYPGAILFCVALLAFIRLALGPVFLAGIGFDTNSLLVASSGLIIGTQLVFFALVAKAYGVVSGLLPADDFTLRALRGNPFEVGIVGGIAITLLGALSFLRAMFMWEDINFGVLSYPTSLRITIPALTMLVIGSQTMFTGFIIALLKLQFDETQS
ncbi:MAG: glycosyltransferase family 2 protein [Oligoflexia bacterium]|nr:glycosyltransferase family 2 protein [Oligoflexia bacterium]